MYMYRDLQTSKTVAFQIVITVLSNTEHSTVAFAAILKYFGIYTTQ